jgi:N-acyl-D-aspartate/D-glutamate deacylase
MNAHAQYDLIIRGGEVVDGTGSAPFAADVAVSDGVIAAIGQVAASGKSEIDARGKIVTPGFVDIHTHYDGHAAWDSRMTPSSWHGVTTAVMGNCGVGFAPVLKENRQLLMEIMAGVEDIPMEVMEAGLKWDWTSFGDYMRALDERPHDIDLCAQVPHAALRVHVMGARAARREAATPADIAQMRRLLAEAIGEGAVGFTTTRAAFHKTGTGDQMPTFGAAGEELVGIAKGLKDANAGVLEYRMDFHIEKDRAADFDIAKRMVLASGRPLTISLFQENKAPEEWKNMLSMVEKAWAQGIPIRGQVAPRQIGNLLGLQCSENPFFTTLAYRSIADKPLAERLRTMRDPSFRARLLAEPRPPQRLVFDLMYWMGERFDYDLAPEQKLTAIAQARGCDVRELAYDMLLDDEGRNFIYFAGANYSYGDFDACSVLLKSPATVSGLGDAGAHVTTTVDASFTTYHLSYWAKKRHSEGFDVPWAVKRLTSESAAAVGLADRGVLALGKKADINVIDLDRIGFERPEMRYDYPRGGGRLVQRATGYTATIVSGVPVYFDGEATSFLPGRIARPSRT